MIIGLIFTLLPTIACIFSAAQSSSAVENFAMKYRYNS